MEQSKIVLIGAGNVAHHLAGALLQAGGNLCQIYSRGIESARALGTRTGVTYATDPREVIPDADIYIYCVSDDALPSVLKSVKVKGAPLFLHTSGSLPAEILKPHARDYGVIYPLQTFSRARDLDFREIPLFIEASSPAVRERLWSFCEELSDALYPTCYEQRRRLHLAAVFACNFPNALYRVASGLLDGVDLPFSVLHPLIFETASKVMTLSPAEAQTGPAARGDEQTIAAHKKQLKAIDAEALTLYTLLTAIIRRGAGENNNENETT